jgi:TolB-like protein
MQKWLVATVLVVGLFIFSGALTFAQACPTICVIIPETVIIHRAPRQIPDPAAETAIIHDFLEYGFHVVDQNQVRAIRYSQLVADAISGQQEVILQLSNRFAADILVLGEAFAEETEVPGELALQSARARIELRAIEAATGTILAADALHTGGIDLTLDTAAKKALQRAGEEISCQLAKAMARHFPQGCVNVVCAPEAPTIGVTPFENQSGVWAGGIRDVLTTMVETALSEQGYKTAHAMAGDFVVTGIITDWKELLTPVLKIPGLDWLWRTGTSWMTVDVRVFDLDTAEVRSYEVTANVTGVEIFGIRFGFSPRDLARKVSKLIITRFGSQY